MLQSGSGAFLTFVILNYTCSDVMYGASAVGGTQEEQGIGTR